jgi:hypothetical protein
MAWVVDTLARFTQPIILLVAGLLAAGASLAVLRLPLIGWSLYAVGYVGLLLALAGLAASYRPLINRVTWVMLGLLYVGILLGLPIVLLIWSYYAQNLAVPDAVLAREVSQLALLKSAAWVGTLLFALATFDSRALPRLGSVMLAVGSVLALAAELGFVGVFSWAFGIIVISLGLVWVAPQPEPEPAATT